MNYKIYKVFKTPMLKNILENCLKLSLLRKLMQMLGERLIV